MVNNIVKSFCITSDNNSQNFAYNIEKLENGNVVFDKLESIDEDLGNAEYRRKFFFKNDLSKSNDILIVSLKDKKISINRYILENKTLNVQKNVANISYEVLLPKIPSELEVGIYDNNKKTICVFDVEKKQEVVSAYSYNSVKKSLSGKYKLNPNKEYIVLKYEK